MEFVRVRDDPIRRRELSPFSAEDKASDILQANGRRQRKVRTTRSGTKAGTTQKAEDQGKCESRH